ncbi:bifunctional diaminohydroxyphosphoribosylaminopyrimidine deaminase/5-amino-6-(5-phosphoribosylamino)uracil reductase RibD [bacterium]|nr:bifunctional diaminohydroxyphosphoribosylaminopyrimidine deaminase/5-amino-6-(5-phosphoribosylamino)uracil reductase RibD [bacterium]
MARAIVLARRGRAWVAPNPMVGAVVVRDGVIVGEGYHRRFGGPHAEVHALKKASKLAQGATLYVNLEPCCHYGKTPPCTRRILESGVARVVAAIEDPNPKVSGKGFQQLLDAGVAVEVGLLADEAALLNQPYLKKAATGRTWVTLKIAQSLDGRIAAITGHSQWISGKQSLRYAHLLRAMHDAVLVGSGTVAADDCQLTVRHVPGRNPVRIVIDSQFRIDPDSKIINTPEDAPTWVFGLKDAPVPDWANNPNVSLFHTDPDGNGRVDLREVHNIISELGVGSLLVEGGSRIWTSFLDLDLVDKVEVVVAPMFIGTGIEAISDLGILKVHDAIRLAPMQWRKIGNDLHVAARVIHRENR